MDHPFLLFISPLYLGLKKRSSAVSNRLSSPPDCLPRDTHDDVVVQHPNPPDLVVGVQPDRFQGEDNRARNQDDQQLGYLSIANSINIYMIILGGGFGQEFFPVSA